MKRYFVVPIILALLSSTGSSSAADKLRFATTVRTHPILVLPVLAAEDKGFWKENGLEVESTLFESDGVAYRAIGAGSVEAGLAGTPGLLLGASRGVGVTIVADMQVFDYGFRLWVRPDSPIRGPQDIKGAKVAVTSYGTLPHVYGLMALKALGLEKEVKFLALGGPPSTIAGFRAKQVDGIILTIFTMANLKARGEAREVISMQDFFPKKWSEIVVFSRKELVKEKPDMIKRMVKAVLQASDFIQKNREWALGKLKAAPFNLEGDVNWLYDRINYGKDGKIDRQALENVLDVLVKHGLIPKEKAVPVDELFTREFTR